MTHAARLALRALLEEHMEELMSIDPEPTTHIEHANMVYALVNSTIKKTKKSDDDEGH